MNSNMLTSIALITVLLTTLTSRTPNNNLLCFLPLVSIPLPHVGYFGENRKGNTTG